MFNVQIDYAYVGQRTQLITIPNTLHIQSSDLTLNAASLYPSLICFNATKISNTPVSACDAQIEVYQIQVTSNTGAEESYIYTIGTNVNSAISNSSQLATLRPDIDDLQNSQNANRIEGYFIHNSTIGNSVPGTRIGSLGKYQSNPSSLGLWSTGQPSAITISIHRLGYVLLNGPSVSVIYSDSQSAPVTKVQLDRLGNGFLYNTILSQDQLQQMDFFNPPI